MLNRHILRIKVMQAVFAYEQHKHANRQWAIQQINEPENFFDEKNEKLTAQQCEDIHKILLKEPQKETAKTITDPTLKKATQKALNFYSTQNKKTLTSIKKDLITEVNKISFWCHSILGLLLAFARISKSYKKIDHSLFFKNTFIVALGENSRLQKLLTTDSINWDGKTPQVLSWFRDIINTNPLYQQYIKSSDHNLASQSKIIKHIIRQLILKGTIEEYFITQDIRWSENQRIVRIMLEKTIKFFNAHAGIIRIPKLSLDWDTDQRFMSTLFENTVNIDPKKRNMIAQNTKNWEIDRISLIDRIILEMAITEIIYCPEIPVKVSINEYIEIAKQYSTDNSPQFVNGVLDTLATLLQKSGEIKKSGRGLLDNK